mgnify:CR=1 FL=1
MQLAIEVGNKGTKNEFNKAMDTLSKAKNLTTERPDLYNALLTGDDKSVTTLIQNPRLTAEICQEVYNSAQKYLESLNNLPSNGVNNSMKILSDDKKLNTERHDLHNALLTGDEKSVATLLQNSTLTSTACQEIYDLTHKFITSHNLGVDEKINKAMKNLSDTVKLITVEHEMYNALLGGNEKSTVENLVDNNKGKDFQAVYNDVHNYLKSQNIGTDEKINGAMEILIEKTKKTDSSQIKPVEKKLITKPHMEFILNATLINADEKLFAKTLEKVIKSQELLIENYKDCYNAAQKHIEEKTYSEIEDINKISKSMEKLELSQKLNNPNVTEHKLYMALITGDMKSMENCLLADATRKPSPHLTETNYQKIYDSAKKFVSEPKNIPNLDKIKIQECMKKLAQEKKLVTSVQIQRN